MGSGVPLWTDDLVLIFYLQGTWECVGVDSGTVFQDVDLSEGEWVDYDEKVSRSPSTRSFWEASRLTAFPVSAAGWYFQRRG